VVHYNKNSGTVPERHVTLLLPERRRSRSICRCNSCRPRRRRRGRAGGCSRKVAGCLQIKGCSLQSKLHPFFFV
jgi:hypothetical protein